jgi:zinc protease
MNDLDALQPDDARAFYKRWYSPQNATVVVVGDVEVSQVQRWAAEIYGAIPARALPARKPREEPAQSGIRRLTVKAPAEQAYVALSWKVPGFKSMEATPSNQDALALTVLSAVLDGYNGSRLDRALTQGADRVADDAGAYHDFSGRGPQIFVLEGVPAAGKTPEALEAALREQVNRIARDGISEAELQRVKAQWVAQAVYKRDSLFNQAREIGTYWVEGLPLDTSDRLIDLLRGVTAEQVKSVAQRYFGDDSLTVAHLLPQPSNAQAPRKPAMPLRHGEGTR